MTMLRRVPIQLLLAITVSSSLLAQSYRPEPYDFVRAKLAADAGDFDEAIAILDRLIEKDRTNSVLLYERVLVFLSDSREDRAESELRKIVSIDPGFVEAQRMLGRLLLDRSGGTGTKVEEALVYLERAWQLDPSDVGTGLTIAQVLIGTGKMDRAEKVLAALVEQAPDQRAVNFSYAQVLTKLGRGSESRVYLERVVAIDPTFGPAVFQLVEIYRDASEFRKAADLLQPLVEAEPLNLDVRRQQALFFLRSGDVSRSADLFQALVAEDPSDARARFFLAESLNDQQKYAEAEKIYRTLMEADARDPDLLASFGLNQMAQRNFDVAARTFEDLLSIKGTPEHFAAIAKTQLCLIEYRRGNLEGALARAREILVFRDRPNLQAVNVALEVLRRGERYREAVSLLDPLLKKFGGERFIVAQSIELYLRAGDLEKARSLGTPYAAKDKQSGMLVAEAYVSATRYDEGIRMITEMLKKTPNDLDLLFELGAFYERAGRSTESERAFLQLLEKNPEHPPTLNYLGYMWADKGVNLERAKEMLVLAVEKDPNNGAFIDSLGWVYFKLGSLDLAEKHLGDAARILPSDPTVQEHLGDVFARKGNVSGALDRYRTALTLSPDPKEEPRLRSKIAEIESRRAE